MLRKIISIILISISTIILFYNDKDISNKQEIIDNIIEEKNQNRIYDGYINITKMNYNLLIKKGSYKEVLDNNLVLMISKKEIFNNEYSNIILAGHNNKYVFNSLYKLNINDEIIISDFYNIYSYKVYKIEKINIKNKEILDNVYDKRILTLITCTNNNQIRYVVKCKYNHTISHN